MIRDIDTNFVYLSDQLPQRFSDFFIRFTRLLDEMEIPWGLVPNTKDIWVRDFMPIQLSDGSFLQYIYTPDYLQEKKYLSLQSDPSVICQEMSLKCKKVDAVLDGGNITLCGDKIVLTNKIVAENHQEGNTLEFLAYLENVFGHEVIMIPWHCLNPEDDDADYFGHSDGFIHWCGGNKVLMSNYRAMTISWIARPSSPACSRNIPSVTMARLTVCSQADISIPLCAGASSAFSAPLSPMR